MESLTNEGVIDTNVVQGGGAIPEWGDVDLMQWDGIDVMGWENVEAGLWADIPPTF